MIRNTRRWLLAVLRRRRSPSAFQPRVENSDGAKQIEPATTSRPASSSCSNTTRTRTPAWTRPATWTAPACCGSRSIRTRTGSGTLGVPRRRSEARESRVFAIERRQGRRVVVRWTDGSVSRIEISGAGDGKITRTEFYEKDTPIRAQEDTDGDGLLDKWGTFEAGRLASVAFDTARSGIAGPPAELLIRPRRRPSRSGS